MRRLWGELRFILHSERMRIGVQLRRMHWRL
jgi:hypothetical protein